MTSAHTAQTRSILGDRATASGVAASEAPAAPGGWVAWRRRSGVVAGELVERRIPTEPERFAAVPGGRPTARIVIEAPRPTVSGSHETLGHEVVVADINGHCWHSSLPSPHHRGARAPPPR